jgi:probable O-glycosylation ligase (exosortase A-associated)
MVQGPAESFIGDNNDLAMALNMVLPIMFFLAREERRPLVRRALWATFSLTLIAIPFTYSRGGMVGLAVVGTLLLFRTRAKAAVVPACLALVLVFWALAPETWVARMQTIKSYEEDQSAMSRFTSWRLGYLIAADRPVTGGGFRVYLTKQTYDRYMPDWSGVVLNAHSIYFLVLAEHGWIGLALFLLLIGAVMLRLRQLRRLRRTKPELEWISNYADMLRISMLGYLISGAFINLAYFDLAYQFMVIAALLAHLARPEASTGSDTAPAITRTGELKPCAV